ncbi:MAG: hypothetical protein AAB840_01805 [Patescibacteria group bacterium]
MGLESLISTNPLASTLNLSSIQITENFLWNTFSIFFVFYVFMTLVFVYHWERYDTPGGFLFWGEVLYFAGSLFLIVTAGMAVSAY